MAVPFLYRTWVAISAALVPFAARSEIAKLREAGVCTDRAHERLGHATQDRQGSGPLIWFHGASVGESLSVIALITRIGEMLPNAQFLLTSGTATSANIISRRLPPRCVHQFAPLDAAGPVKRFLTHWQPEAAVFVESELWPQLLRRSYESGAKMAMVNARLSERSVQKWRRQPKLARYLLEVFSLILTQNDKMAGVMLGLNAPPDRIVTGVNLKSMSAPLPVDQAALHAAHKALGKRPVWVASSTHEGEEEMVLEAHKTLLARNPDLCLILAPRHPERGDKLADLITDKGLPLTRRSTGDAPGGQVYLADTLGELGLWYSLADIVFLGGSLKPIGGHNPYEVAQASAAVISGPHVTNFAETYDDMARSAAATMIEDTPGALTSAVAKLLDDKAALNAACAASTAFATGQQGKLDDVATQLIAALGLSPNA